MSDFDDGLLDDLLAGLGTPPAAVPRADAAAILGRAALVGAPVAAAGAILGWKLWGMGLLVAALGFGGGYVARGPGAPQTVVIVPAPPESPQASELSSPSEAASADGGAVASPHDAERVPSRGAPPVQRAPLVIVSAVPGPACPEPTPTPAAAAEFFADVDEARGQDVVVVATWPADPGDPVEPDEDPSAAPTPLRAEEPSASVTARGRTEGPRVAVLAGVGAFGGFGAWRDRAPLVGPGIHGVIALVGDGRAAIQPTVRFGGDAVLLSGNDEQESRFVGGLQVDGGFVLGRRRVRLDVAWSGSVRVMPPASDIDGLEDEEAGWIFGGTGPELGLAIGRPGAGAFRLGVLVHGSVIDLDGDGQVGLVPWLGLTLGAELPLGPRR